MNRAEFIKIMTPEVLQAIKATNAQIWPSVVLARAIIESQNSKGLFLQTKLQTEGKNLFGITASKNYTGDKILIKTWEGRKISIYGNEKYLGEKNGRFEYLRYFRAYNSYAESIADFIKLITGSNRYKAANNKALTPEEQAAIISDGGYATAPNAKQLFLSVVKSINKNFGAAFEEVKKKIVNNPGASSGLLLLVLAAFGLAVVSKKNGK